MNIKLRAERLKKKLGTFPAVVIVDGNSFKVYPAEALAGVFTKDIETDALAEALQVTLEGVKND